MKENNLSEIILENRCRSALLSLSHSFLIKIKSFSLVQFENYRRSDTFFLFFFLLLEKNYVLWKEEHS